MANLAGMFGNGGKRIAVVTSAYDLHEKEVLKDITPGRWNDINGSRVRYLDNSEQSYRVIKAVITEQLPQCLYLNGMYSLSFVVFPLLIRSRHFPAMKTVWAPRGMLQPGALSVKPLKKILFLKALRLAGLHRNITWHATDAQEVSDVRRHFGQDAAVVMAPNIPKIPFGQVAGIEKQKGELRLVFLSLISEKKNLVAALDLLADLNLPVVFDIYGPVKDATYWEKCRALIARMPATVKVTYKGDVKPGDVQHVFSGYHALFLPSKGENFGHAIYESLSVGRPVIVSTETPWKNLESKNAGFDIPLAQPALFKTAIRKLHEMDGNEYSAWCHNALVVAGDYWQQTDFRSAYAILFDNENRRTAEL